jgi:signal transduction histidine kinase
VLVAHDLWRAWHTSGGCSNAITVALAAARPDYGGQPRAGGRMSENERLNKLRHDLSNPLSALLAETQLLLLNESQIDPETLTSLREIEALAIRMRAMLREL